MDGVVVMNARRDLRLAMVLWFSRFLLAVPATAAFFFWWAMSLRYVPGADVLLKHLDFGVLIDMAEDNSASVWGLILVTLFATSAVAMIVNALLAGGTFEILIKPKEPHSFSHMFFRGAGHFFWRNMNLLALTLAATAVVTGMVVGGLRFALKPLENSLSIFVSWATLLIPMIVASVLILFFCVFVLDYSRIDLVLTGRKRAIHAWWHGLKLALRHFWTTLRIWAVIGVGLLVIVAICIAARKIASEYNWALIAMIFLVQQLAFFAAAFLRVFGLSRVVRIATDARVGD